MTTNLDGLMRLVDYYGQNVAAAELHDAADAHRGDPVIITVTPTIMDGTVVRWYRTEDAAEYGREMLSASRNGVAVHCYLHEVPAAALDDAERAYEAMGRDRRADVSHLATHRRRGMRGPLEPITTAANPPGAGYDREPPNWPCETSELIADQVGVSLRDPDPTEGLHGRSA